MSSIRFVPFEGERTAEYCMFASESWGAGAYQAKPAYLDWLYRENPSAGGEPDFLLAVTEAGQLVGAVHRMNLPWNLDGRIETVPAAHNLYVREHYRTGTGLYLLLAMMKNQDHVFCPSQVPPLADTLDRLRWQEATVRWYRRILSPTAAALRLARNRLPGGQPPRMTAAAIAPAPRNLGAGIQATVTPSEGTIGELSRAMRERLAGVREKPHWTPELVHWRFFHPIGPKHLLVHDRDGQFLILSLGRRHGLNTSRIIDGSCASPEKMALMVQKTEKFLSRHGVHVLLGFSSDHQLQSALECAGWRPLTGHTRRTFFYHRDKSARFTRYAFNASAGDFGFEAFA